MKYSIRRDSVPLERLQALDAECFNESEGLEFALGGSLWVVRGEGEIVAYACAYIRAGVLDLTRCAVHPSHRGQGLQRRLIRARMRWGRANGAVAAWTYTHAGNTYSMRSLIKEGFLPSLLEKGFLEFGRALCTQPEVKK